MLERFKLQRTNYATFDEDITELPTILTYVEVYGQGVPPPIKLVDDFNITFQSIPSGNIELSPTKFDLVENGYYPVETYQNQTLGVEFESGLHGFNDFTITPVITPGLSLESVGDLALTYTFKNDSAMNIPISIGIELTTENNSISGSILLDKFEFYDGRHLVFQKKIGHNKRVAYKAEKYITLMNCRNEPFNDILFRQISLHIVGF